MRGRRDIRLPLPVRRHRFIPHANNSVEYPNKESVPPFKLSTEPKVLLTDTIDPCERLRSLHIIPFNLEASGYLTPSAQTVQL